MSDVVRDGGLATLGVLFVCTANRCRSPLAEAIARELLPGTAITFSSAGVLDGGHRVPDDGVRTAARLGLDLSGHVSRQVTSTDLDNADLILTMTREQARELIIEHPDAWPRVFLLTSFAGWLDAHPRPPGASLPAWIREEGAARSRTDLVGGAREDEIADPLGRPPRVWRAVAAVLRAELSEVLTRLDQGVTTSSP